MNESQLWISLVLGIFPYRIDKTSCLFGCKLLQIQAIFWSFTAAYQFGTCVAWTLQIPAIERPIEVILTIIARRNQNRSD